MTSRSVRESDAITGIADVTKMRWGHVTRQSSGGPGERKFTRVLEVEFFVLISWLRICSEPYAIDMEVLGEDQALQAVLGKFRNVFHTFKTV